MTQTAKNEQKSEPHKGGYYFDIEAYLLDSKLGTYYVDIETNTEGFMEPSEDMSKYYE